MSVLTQRQGTDVRADDGECAQLFEVYAATQDRRVRDELVLRHRWLARACARQMHRRSEPMDELEQVALIGVFKAVERFDPTYGVQFRTFATVTVFGELRRHYRDRGWAVRVPRRLKDLHLMVQHAVDALTASLGRSPTPAEVAGWLEVGEEEVLEAMEAGDSMRTGPLLDTSAGVRRDQLGRDDHTIDQVVDVVDDRAVIRRLIATLSPQQRAVVGLRFYTELTQREIGQIVGLSQVQVSRLLRAAIEQMRAAAQDSLPLS